MPRFIGAARIRACFATLLLSRKTTELLRSATHLKTSSYQDQQGEFSPCVHGHYDMIRFGGGQNLTPVKSTSKIYSLYPVVVRPLRGGVQDKGGG